MKTFGHPQGSDAWHTHRASHFNASDAPAMLGMSPHKTRSQLLREIATGITPEIDPATQLRFDEGHRIEALARPLAEELLGESLPPAVGYEGKLSASFDGLTKDGSICWEHKTINAAYRKAIQTGGTLPAALLAQIEQQLMISGADRCLFTATRWDGEECVECVHRFVKIDPELRAELIAGWKQFAIDLEAYEHTEAIAAPVAASIEALPALFVQVEGKVLATNLDAFKLAAQTFIDGIKTELFSDQDFADADKMVKFLKDGEDRLALAKSQALAQTASIDELFRTVDAISEQMRVKRLALGKLVAAEKDNRRADIIRGAQDALTKHIDKLNERVGGLMPRTIAPFAEAIKGLKSIDSMRDKVSTALANAKIEANEIADRIQANRFDMVGNGLDWSFLFPDFSAVCTKARDDFGCLLVARLAKHNEAQAAKDKAAKDAEDARVAAAVEAERKAGETRAAAAIEVERLAEAKRISEQAAKDQRAKADDTTHAQQITSASSPLTPEEKRTVLVDAGDDVRAYLNTLCLSDKEFGRLRAVIMGYEQFKAARRVTTTRLQADRNQVTWGGDDAY